MRKSFPLATVLAGILLPLTGLVSTFFSTRRHMADFRTRLAPGVTLAELQSFVGRPPARILHRGDPVERPNRSYTIPTIDEHTAIYVYPKEGIPYYNVYVFVDERRGTVIRSDVQQLGSWW